MLTLFFTLNFDKFSLPVDIKSLTVAEARSQPLRPELLEIKISFNFHLTKYYL